MVVRKATSDDVGVVAKLALLLWPDHTHQELEGEFTTLIQSLNAAIFLVFLDEEPVGFAQVELRCDYVEGTSTSPVGYLEGIYVEPSVRRSGIARTLIEECESWAWRHGCTEFASDCELGNEVSRNVHLNLGFSEANRIICFAKKLEERGIGSDDYEQDPRIADSVPGKLNGGK